MLIQSDYHIHASFYRVKGPGADPGPTAAEQLHLTAKDLLDIKVADEIVKEPLGGAHRDFDAAAQLMGDALARHLEELCAISPEELKEQRYRKFRTIGAFLENGGSAA